MSLAAVLAPPRPPSGLRLGSYNNWWHPTHSPRPARGHIFSFPLPPRTLPRTASRPASRPTSPAISISISISSAQSASPCSPWRLPVNSHPIGSRAQSRPVETRLPTAAGYRQHGAKQLRSVLSLLHGLAIGGVYLPGAYASVSGGSVLASAPSSLHRSVPTRTSALLHCTLTPLLAPLASASATVTVSAAAPAPLPPCPRLLDIVRFRAHPCAGVREIFCSQF